MVGRFEVDRKHTLSNVSAVLEVAPLEGASRMDTDTSGKPCQVWWEDWALLLGQFLTTCG